MINCPKKSVSTTDNLNEIIYLINKYWKYRNIEYQKNTHSQTLLSRPLHLPVSVDYKILARLKIDWACQILYLSSLLLTHFLLFMIDISIFGTLNFFFAFLFLVIKATVRPESLISLIFWRFSPLFGDSVGPYNSIFLILFFVSHGSMLFIQNIWEVYITNSIFSSF